MATYTSTQSGNWTSASTWGGSGTPNATGDIVNVSKGHTVTINSDIRVTTGFDNINIYGRLLLSSGAKIRVNGQMIVYGGSLYFTEGNATSGGKLEAGSNTLIELAGDNTAQHGIIVRAETYTWCELIGTEKNLSTTLTSAATYNDYYLTCNSVTGFVQGDWISTFKRDLDHRVDRDEGFWVHDVDSTNKRIYVRMFVGPTATIQSASGNKITVDNAKVFRRNYRIVFGTGANRNTHQITNITGNVITLSGNVTGTVTGLTVYQSGVEKKHQNGDPVKRVATTLTTQINANATNQITVGDASDIAVGDFILIDVNNDVNFDYNYNAKYQVTGKSGNTLTLGATVAYKHFAGSIVTIVTRDCQVFAADDSSNTRVFFNHTYWTSGNGYYRRLRLQNVWFKGLGYNTNSAYYGGVGHHGYMSYLQEGSSDNRYNYESRLDSCVNDTPNFRSSYTSFLGRLTNLFIVRNCISYYTERGYWIYSTTYNIRYYNNYATRNYYTSFLADTLYEPLTRIQYFYGTRSDDYGFMVHQRRESTTAPISHVILLNHRFRPFYTYYGTAGYYFNRFHFDGFRYWPFAGIGGEYYFLDSYIRNTWDATSPTGTGLVYSNYLEFQQEGYSDFNRNAGKTNYIQFIDYNFEEGSIAQLRGWLLREWNTEQQYWKCYANRGNAGAIEQVYVPADTAVRVSCDVRTQSNGSFSYPILIAFSQHSGWYRGQYEEVYTDTSVNSSTTNSTHGSRFIGFQESAAYTSLSQSGFETKQLTVAAQPKGYFLLVGIYTPSTNIREEPFFMRNVNIYLEQAAPAALSLPSSQPKKYGVRSSFTPAKKRIGGTRL